MRARSLALSTNLLLACAVHAVPAFADWPAEGREVLCALQSWRGLGYVRIIEMPSGDLMVVAEGIGGSGAGWSASRITREGDPAPGWTAHGIGMGTTNIDPKAAGYCPDDSSGLWLVHGSNGYHVLPDGSLETPPASNAFGWADAAPASGSSDVYLTNLGIASNRVRRMTRTGTPAAGWPAAGIDALPNSSSVSQPAILPDGAGGCVYVGQAEFGAERAMRVDANGSLHAGWPSVGLVLGASTNDDPVFPPKRPLRTLVTSGTDHFIAVWPDLADGSLEVQRVLLQRFGLDGTLDPAWPASGLQAVAPDSIRDVTLVADGEGGAYVLWERSGRPRGTHVRADGSFAGALDDTGVPLLPADAPYTSMPDGSSVGQYLVADHGPGGGLVFAGGEEFPGPSYAMRARWYSPDLTLDPAVPDTGVRVPGWKPRAALADGEGGIYLAWQGAACTLFDPYDLGVQMTRVPYPATSDVPPAVGAALSLGGAMPNPVRNALALRFTLPDDRPARLELFDASGRRMRGVDVRGAGTHVQRFDDLGALAPGLYLARLTQGATSRTTRFVRIP